VERLTQPTAMRMLKELERTQGGKTEWCAAGSVLQDVHVCMRAPVVWSSPCQHVCPTYKRDCCEPPCGPSNCSLVHIDQVSPTRILLYTLPQRNKPVPVKVFQTPSTHPKAYCKRRDCQAEAPDPGRDDCHGGAPLHSQGRRRRGAGASACERRVGNQGMTRHSVKTPASSRVHLQESGLSRSTLGRSFAGGAAGVRGRQGDLCPGQRGEGR
jgi:hypothetical protein